MLSRESYLANTGPMSALIHAAVCAHSARRQECLDWADRDGDCIMASNCPAIFKIIRNGPTSQDIKNIRDSVCGFRVSRQPTGVPRGAAAPVSLWQRRSIGVVMAAQQRRCGSAAAPVSLWQHRIMAAQKRGCHGCAAALVWLLPGSDLFH